MNLWVMKAIVMYGDKIRLIKRLSDMRRQESNKHEINK